MKARIVLHTVAFALLLCLNSIACSATITFDDDSLLGSYRVGDTISSDGFDILVGGDPRRRTSTRVQATNIAGGTGNELQSFADRELIFQLTESYASASFKFKNSGGTNFININGVSTPLVGGFGLLNGMSYGGVDFLATGSSLGTLTLTGEINSLTISGQELAIDDVSFPSETIPPIPFPRTTFESHILTPSDTSANTRFGTAVGIDGRVAVVSSPGTGSKGAVTSYDVVSGNVIAEFDVDGLDEFDAIGGSVAIDGKIAIVGDAGDRSRVFLFDATSGQRLLSLKPADAPKFSGYVTDVAVSGSRAVVGAVGNVRAAYVFDVETGAQSLKIEDPLNTSPRFASAIDIDLNSVIVGNPASRSPSAIVFDATSGQQLQHLTPTGRVTSHHFGDAVAIQGDLALVGAPEEDIESVDAAGAAYLFEISTGKQLAKFVSPDLVDFGHFGSAVDLDGDHVIIGATYNDTPTLDQQRTFIFDITTGEQLLELVSSNQQVDDHYGYSVGISGNHAVVGAYSHTLDGNPNLHYSGTAYLFAVPEPSTASLLILCLALGSMAQRPHHQGD